jgi:hypothetical protein
MTKFAVAATVPHWHMTDLPRDATPIDVSQPFLVTADGAPGLSRTQARSTRFVAPSRGIRLHAGIAGQLPAEATAALLASRPSALVVDISAARLWGLPVPPWIGLDGEAFPVSVAQAPNGARPERRGVVGRRLRMPPEHVAEIDGIRVTSPARTWLDCAERIPTDHLVAMGDAALHRTLTTPTELKDVVVWARRRRGVVSARRALQLLDGASESPGESLTRFHLLECGVPRPVCNFNVIVDGEWCARVDLAWPGERVAVEYDGIVHLSETARRRDAARRNLLQDVGWTVIVFTAADLKYPWAMAALVRSALRRQGAVNPR